MILAYSPKDFAIVFLQLFPGDEMGVLLGDDDEVHGLEQQMLAPAEKGSKSPFDSVSHDGMTDFFTGNHSHPGIAQIIDEVDEVEVSASETVAFIIKIRKFLFFSNPLLGCESL
jgi:hypothetical protein